MKKSLLLLLIIICGIVTAQEKMGPSGQYPVPVRFTTQQDHQNMMDQLGIKKLRPGPSGNESSPNHANYNESVATPYPAKDLGVSNDYKKEIMPPYNTGMLDGHLAWRQQVYRA